MNYGIVGLGKQGKQHLSALLSLSKIDTNINVYLCDIDKIYINQLARELNLISYCSCAEMLQNINIDILILALPNDKYKEVLDLPECKNILIIKEKPFAMNLNEANLFLKFAKDKNLSLNISQHRYFTNHYVLAKEWLSQNLIGNILFFEYRYTLNDQKESWYWDLKSGGGCWLNVGWHCTAVPRE
jgi:predicted dehydrogenase